MRLFDDRAGVDGDEDIEIVDEEPSVELVALAKGAQDHLAARNASTPMGGSHYPNCLAQNPLT